MRFSKALVHDGVKEGPLVVPMETKRKNGRQRFVQVKINKEGLTAKLLNNHVKCNKILEKEEINRLFFFFVLFFFKHTDLQLSIFKLELGDIALMQW